MRRVFVAIAVALCATASFSEARAQTFPTVRIRKDPGTKSKSEADCPEGCKRGPGFCDPGCKVLKERERSLRERIERIVKEWTKSKSEAPVLRKCPEGYEQQGGRCYSRCKEGYKGVGPLCWESCPDARGVLCGKRPRKVYNRGKGKPLESFRKTGNSSRSRSTPR